MYCTTQCFVYQITAVILKTAKGNLENKIGFTNSVEHKYHKRA